MYLKQGRALLVDSGDKEKRCEVAQGLRNCRLRRSASGYDIRPHPGPCKYFQLPRPLEYKNPHVFSVADCHPRHSN